MALTANTFPTIGQTRNKLAFRVKDAETIFAGAFVALAGPSHATADGYALNYVADVAGIIPCGWALQKVVGNISATPVPEVEVDIGGRLVEKCAVTGAAGDITDVGKPVYLTDNGTFTLTAPTSGQRRVKIGYVTQFVSAGVADVYTFSFAELLALYHATNGEIPAV